MKLPATIRNGSVSVKIYRAAVKTNGRKYDSFLVRYHVAGKLIQKRFPLLDDPEKPQESALQFAKDKADQLSLGKLGDALLTESEKAGFSRAKELVAETGKGIELIAAEYAEAFKILGGVSIVEAARYYRRQHPAGFIKKTIGEVAGEMYKAKASDKLSAEWIRSLKVRVGKLQERFGKDKPISELNGVDVNEWLQSLGLAGKTRNNYRGAVQALISFAKSKKYLAKDFAEMEYVSTVEDEDGEILIYTPDEIRKLLKHSRGSLRYFIAFGAFAGLRSAEIARLDWAQVRSDGVEIKAFTKGKRHAKTGRRRIAPMLPPLAEIIKGHPRNGRVWPAKKENPGHRTLFYLKQRSGVEWKRNGLRHSFISYRLASIKNVSQVEHECGTSEEKIFKNYRQLVTEEAAKEWFNFTKPLQGSKATENKTEKNEV